MLKNSIKIWNGKFEVFKTQWKHCWSKIQVVSASREKAKVEKLEFNDYNLKTARVPQEKQQWLTKFGSTF